MEEEEVRFSYENCSGISASYDLDAFYDVHIIYDNTDNLTESLTSIQFSVKKKGIAYIYIHRNLETEPHHFEDEITGTIIIGCKKRNDSITCDASFNNLKCIMARQG